MTHQLLNTLYVTTPGAYLRLQNETVYVEHEGQKLLQVPLLHIGAIITFGETMISPLLMHHCAETGISLSLLDRNGAFKARVEGPVNGNVLLRQAQYHTTAEKGVELARHIVAAKIRNSRHNLLRSARDAEKKEDAEILKNTAETIGKLLRSLAAAVDMEVIRGLEGEAARSYFSAFSCMVKPAYREAFAFTSRSRRPPLDRINALLSFFYTLLTHDARAALESAGLDPQWGFLHSLRPGRPSLALDLMEEFRSIIADRLALTLINRGQVKEKDFTIRPGGAVHLSDEARKTVLVSYQERKKETVTHPLLKSAVPYGLLPFVQARLLARTLRGDMEAYVPFLAK